MKIDYSKALPITIAILAGVIITLSIIWYGLDAWGVVVVGVFIAGGVAIAIDKYFTRKK